MTRTMDWIDERRVTLEILTSIRRASADMILTYHARRGEVGEVRRPAPHYAGAEPVSFATSVFG
jgi:hypothetical protein